ncbi:hypothetical protein ColTof4_01387 [Colletotrichum tofieldiae]|nr:hypothetical protein ColTof3_08641 [Colletotrichum tofieldiae]GKT68964.1 hypothetical protein ColTof4_01387 [Colletotrichum tofieldiae]
MPLNNAAARPTETHYQGLEINPQMRIHWSLKDRIVFLSHIAKHQLTHLSVDYHLEELHQRLGIAGMGRRYIEIVYPRVYNALKARIAEFRASEVHRPVLVSVTEGGETRFYPKFMKAWAQQGWEGDISEPPHDDELPLPVGHDDDRSEPDVDSDVMQDEQQRQNELLGGREANNRDSLRPESTTVAVEMETPAPAQPRSWVPVPPSPGRGIGISGLGIGIPRFDGAGFRVGNRSLPMANREEASHGLFFPRRGADTLHITVPSHHGGHCEEAAEQQRTQRTGDDPLPYHLQPYQSRLRDENRPSMLRKPWVHDGGSKIPLLVRVASAPIPVSSPHRRRLGCDATTLGFLPRNKPLVVAPPYVASDMLRQYKEALMRLVDLNLKHRFCQCEVAKCCALADGETPFERDVEAHVYRGRRISRDAREVRARLVELDRELEKRGYASGGDGIGPVGALTLIPEDWPGRY